MRILKKIRNEMDDAFIAAAKPIPGFLIECMVWNAPTACFKGDTWDDKVQAVFLHLWSSTKDYGPCKDWKEVNNIKLLFNSDQPWTQREAHDFIFAAWSYVGIR